MTRSFLLSLAAVAALGCASQASAQINPGDSVVEGYSHDPGVVIHSTGVNYADLDLSSSAGRDALYGRIEAAAARVCAPPPSDDQYDREDYNDCRTTAITQAMTLLRSPDRAAMADLKKRNAGKFAALH